MITQYALSELGHTERIEAPIDGMPTLECIVRWYEHRIGIIIHNARQIAFRKEVLEDFCARLHVGQKWHQWTRLWFLYNGFHFGVCICNVWLLQGLWVIVATAAGRDRERGMCVSEKEVCRKVWEAESFCLCVLINFAWVHFLTANKLVALERLHSAKMGVTLSAKQYLYFIICIENGPFIEKYMAHFCDLCSSLLLKICPTFSECKYCLPGFHSLVRFLYVTLGVGRFSITQITINSNGHHMLIDTQLVEYLLSIE